MQQDNPKNRRRKSALRRRTHNVLLLGVFLLLVLILALGNLISPNLEFSQTENRSLAQRPSLTAEALLDGSYFDAVTAHYADQFILRDSWIALKRNIDSHLGKSDASGVYFGAEDYLLAVPEEPDTEALRETVAAINRFAEDNKSISMRMMVIPSASVILEDKLPKNAPLRDQLLDLSSLESGLLGSVQYLDVTETLRSHKNEDIYYHTDHHWTTLGARYTFEATAAQMGITDPVSAYDTYTVATDFEGTLSSKCGSHTYLDTVEICVPKVQDLEFFVTYPSTMKKTCSLYDSAALTQKDKYTVFFGGNHPMVELSTTVKSGRSLLLFKDSYANCFVPFLTPYYEKIYMVDPRYYYDDLSALLASGGVTDVLFLYSADNILTDTALSDVLDAMAEEKEPLNEESPMEPAPVLPPDTPQEIPEGSVAELA